MKKSSMWSNPRCWMICADCGERELMMRSMLDRRCRVRCRACGGPIEPSVKAANDLVKGMDRLREHPEKRA